MKVKTKVKVGTVLDDIAALVSDWWDDLPEWLTWPL